MSKRADGAGHIAIVAAVAAVLTAAPWAIGPTGLGDHPIDSGSGDADELRGVAGVTVVAR